MVNLDPLVACSPRARRCRAAALALAVTLCVSTAWADTIRFGGTGSAIGTVTRLAQAYQKLDPSFQLEVVPNLGSSGGVKAVASGAIQLGATSRTLRPEETTAGLRLVEYGRTAFVLATAKEGIKGLTTREIADLYAGRQARWADGQLVRVVLRPASDADAALLGSFSSDVKAAQEAAQAREGMVVGMTDQETVDAIERLPGGLGTATMALLLSEQRRAKALEIDGTAPTLANVASGRYPYTKTMYLVMRGDAPASLRRFIEFVGSPLGHRILGETGHVVGQSPVAAR